MKRSWRKGLLFVFVFIAFCFLTGLSHLLVPAFGSPSETIPVSIHAYAQWNHIVKDSNGEDLLEESGFYRIMITGSMTFDPSGSPMVSQQGIMVMPVEKYLPDNLNATWIYEEITKDLKSETRCPIISNYKGSNSARITDGPGLLINNFSSAAAPFMENLSEKEKQFAAQLQSRFQSQMKNAMPDYYQLALSGGTPSMDVQKITVRGTRLKDPKDCIYEDVEKSFPGFSIGLQMQLPDSGTMTGYRFWKSNYEGGVPGFGISVSDMTEFKGEKPFDPPQGGNGDVSYTLIWFIGVEPMPIPMSAEDDEEEDDCEKLADRIKMVKNILEAYGDPMLREEIKSKYGDNAREEYQDAVEKRVMEQVPRAPGEAPPEPRALLWTTPFTGSPQGGNVTQVTINGKVNGTNTVLITYDGNGNEVGGDYDSIEAMLTDWENTYGEDAGRIRFNAALNHEKVHVEQYADDEGGIPETVDDLAEYEIEAFSEEMNYLMREYEEMGCSSE
ncbi:MAG TPA: hypothetical protein PLK59_09290 [Synergistales bacterium]|nr:hypothetical protein [Synergistales bacterium]